jgi:hypothetical protein
MFKAAAQRMEELERRIDALEVEVMASRTDKGCIIPTLRYRDAAAAIEWLCRAFGFEKHLVVPGEGATIAHAQLRYGNGMIMLGSERDDDFGKLQRTPRAGRRRRDQSLHHRARRRHASCSRRRAGAGRSTAEGRGLRRPRLLLPRSEGHLWNWHLRSVGLLTASACRPARRRDQRRDGAPIPRRADPAPRREDLLLRRHAERDVLEHVDRQIRELRWIELVLNRNHADRQAGAR